MKYINPFFITELLFCPSARSFVHFSWHWWSPLSAPQTWQPKMQETRDEDLHSHELDWDALWWILILTSLLLSNFCCYALCSSFATTLPTKVLHFVLFCNSCDLLSLDREISLSILRQLRFEGSTPTSQELSSSIFQSLSGIGNIPPNVHLFKYIKA